MVKKQTAQADRLIGVTEAAELAGVNRKTIDRWLKAGHIGGEPIQFGGRTYMRVSVLSLETYLKQKADRSS